jgi:Large polyvalent protein associated domain 22
MSNLESEFDTLIAEDQANRSTQLRANMLGAASTKPEQYKNVIDISKKSGLHPDLVDGHEAELAPKIREKELTSQFDDIIQNSPGLATFLSDPTNARLAHEDTESLSWIETMGRGIASRGANIVSGLARSVGTATVGLAQDLESAIPLGSLDYDSKGGIIWRASKPSDFTGAGTFQQTTDEFAKIGKDINYQPGTAWEDVKKSPLKEFIPFAIEQGIVLRPICWLQFMHYRLILLQGLAN